MHPGLSRKALTTVIRSVPLYTSASIQDDKNSRLRCLETEPMMNYSGQRIGRDVSHFMKGTTEWYKSESVYGTVRQESSLTRREVCQQYNQGQTDNLCPNCSQTQSKFTMFRPVLQANCWFRRHTEWENVRIAGKFPRENWYKINALAFEKLVDFYQNSMKNRFSD